MNMKDAINAGGKVLSKGTDRNGGNASWRVRRRIIVLTLVFCAVLVAYITFKGTDSRTEETIVQSAFALAGAVIASYVFGATWEDNNKINTLINSGIITNVNTDPPPAQNPPAGTGNVDNPDKK